MKFKATGLKINGELVDVKSILDTHAHLNGGKTYSFDFDSIASGSVTVPLYEGSPLLIDEEAIRSCDVLLLTEIEIYIDGEWQPRDEETYVFLPKPQVFTASWKAGVHIGEHFRGILKPVFYDGNPVDNARLSREDET